MTENSSESLDGGLRPTTGYDALWNGCWGGMQDVGPVHRHTARIIVETLRPLNIHSLLDVGCGNGANLEAIQQALHIPEVAGIDVSEAALQGARQRVAGEFVAMDVLSERLPRRFDAVLSSQVIEHIDDDERFLAQIRAMCDRYCFIGTMQGRMRPSERKIGHVRNYTRAGLEQKLTRAGFAVERAIEWGFPFYSPLYRTLIEYAGGGATAAPQGGTGRLLARAMYQLYRLNSARRGDILMLLARAV